MTVSNNDYVSFRPLLAEEAEPRLAIFRHAEITIWIGSFLRSLSYILLSFGEASGPTALRPRVAGEDDEPSNASHQPCCNGQALSGRVFSPRLSKPVFNEMVG